VEHEHRPAGGRRPLTGAGARLRDRGTPARLTRLLPSAAPAAAAAVLLAAPPDDPRAARPSGSRAVSSRAPHGA
jgi:hypothetical protein